jgi:alpha-glucuronidase
VQAAQEYTGQQIHAVNLLTMWEEYLDFDTFHGGKGSTIRKLLSNTSTPTAIPGKHTGPDRKISGLACISNFGTYANWTGHVLAGSNSFGFGRLAWSARMTSKQINTEWAELTFPASTPAVVHTVVDILQRSRDIYEGYTSPLGIGFIVFGGGDYKPGAGGCASMINDAWHPSPASRQPGAGPDGALCPTSPGVDGDSSSQSSRRRLDLHGGLDHYWVDPCSNTGISNYSSFGLGCDRTTNSMYGTGYAGDYAPENTAMYNDVTRCPLRLLLWFHNLPWNHTMPKPSNYPAPLSSSGNDTITLYEHIRFTHVDAVRQAADLAAQWESLQGAVDTLRFEGVRARFAQQVRDAKQMAHDIMVQYTAWMEAGRQN